MLLTATLVAAPLPAQNLPSLGDTERGDLSPLMERRLGERIMTDLRRDRDYLDDQPLREYLNSLGASLLAARPDARGEAGYDFQFFAVRDPMLNAFALPGGFIGVHTGLMLASQNESELASVLSHEIGHVAQRHIARMIGSQRQDSLIPLAAMLLAALTARSSPDFASAAMAGGQGLAIQRQLNFSREAEREADRVGLQIMREGGFDTSGMVAFFARLQSSARAYTDTAPAYLRTHPLTTERIADIQARISSDRYRQHADSGDFQLMRARSRVLQDPSTQGLRDAASHFQTLLQQRNRSQMLAARYGLAMVALRQGDAVRAQALLDEARAQDRNVVSPALASLGIEIASAARRADDALKLADEARRRFPLSRGIASQYGEALLLAGRQDEAVRYLRDQIQLYRQEPGLQDKLARAYSAQGKLALQHMALAESYALKGSIPAALDQLGMARRAPDASFYDQSVIDARERELRAQRLEQLKDKELR
ncbi:beta-barrel assembly-enhancing protease [Lacisediminimonas profundi]|uniref:beta-barrel assembly-enhancing protease n=1 Tax=Lacisediminimonas profundi TaxID=2603856 RepID=UPI00124B21CB|nr:M48 family metalloprotease [Lacisediminimonas profundi]